MNLRIITKIINQCNNISDIDGCTLGEQTLISFMIIYFFKILLK